MSSGITSPATDHSLVDALVRAFIATGKIKAVLPEGRKGEYVARLTRTMVRRDQLGEYIEALNAARHRHGVDDLLRQLPVAERQVEAIAAQGLEILSAEELADLAIRPNALECLHEFINEMLSAGEAGPSWWRAIEQENKKIPADYLPAASVDRMVARLKAYGESQEETRYGGRISRVQRLRRALTQFPRLGVGFAAAAVCLIIGISIGSKLSTNVTGIRDIVLAKVEVRGDITRGPEDVQLEVTNNSNRRAFVTVVGLTAGKKYVPLFYREGNRFLDVPSRGTVTVKNLPPEFAESTNVLIVLSDVPAGEAIRLSLPASISPDKAAELAVQLRNALQDLGIASDIQAKALQETKQ